jgi:hypothetical protein
MSDLGYRGDGWKWKRLTWESRGRHVVVGEVVETGIQGPNCPLPSHRCVTNERMIERLRDWEIERMIERLGKVSFGFERLTRIGEWKIRHPGSQLSPVVIIIMWPSPPYNPVCERRVDPSDLAFSLVFHHTVRKEGRGWIKKIRVSEGLQPRTLLTPDPPTPP